MCRRFRMVEARLDAKGVDLACHKKITVNMSQIYHTVTDAVAELGEVGVGNCVVVIEKL